MKIAIVINSLRLTPALKSILESDQLTKKFNINYDLFISEPKELETTLTQLNIASYNAILIGGGDGTVRTAAQILRQTELPMAILPLGTFNLLAKSMGYPTEINEIFNIIKNKKTKSIDVAEVNNEIIINHAWLGFYSYILKMRKKHSNIIGRSKLLKAGFGAFWMFNYMPIYEFQIKIKNDIKTYKTCLIFISNNETCGQLFDLGARTLLATGLLQVIILNCHTRWQLLVCILSILFTPIKKSKYLSHFNVDELNIYVPKKTTHIVIDGELLELKIPMRFVNHKNQLLMISP